MKIKFIGVGSAFTTMRYYQSNMLIIADSGKTLLLDCGSDIRFSLQDAGILANELVRKIDAIYISHLHADHIGGLEWVAFNSCFGPDARPLELYMNAESMAELWDHSLQGGLKCIEGKVMRLEDYFSCCPVDSGNGFVWEGIAFTLLRMPHIMAGETNHYSYGLLMENQAGNGTAFITTDTMFQPEILTDVSLRADLIFHDTETGPFHTNVHAHYDDLCTLPPHIKRKMWLYHYQPEPGQDPVSDGFLGFVEKGQEFEINGFDGR